MQILKVIGSNVRKLWTHKHGTASHSSSTASIVILKGNSTATTTTTIFSNKLEKKKFKNRSSVEEEMRRMNNLVTLFTAILAFFFGSFLTTMLSNLDDSKCAIQRSAVTQLTTHPEIFLMLLILSSPQHANKRQVMRETFLQLVPPLKLPYYPEDFIYVPVYNKRGHLEMESITDQAHHLQLYVEWLQELQQKPLETRRNIRIKHFFAIGMANLPADQRTTIQQEQKHYKDMLLLPRLIDNYANLTIKLLHSIETLTQHYEFSYLLKADDDTYIKLNYLLNELLSYDRKLLRRVPEYRNELLPQLYWGYFNGRANIKTRGPWSENNYYLAKHYITYALGGGYVLSRQLCEYVSNNSHSLTPYVSEDVSMGTWLAALRHVYRRHDPRFDTGYMPRKYRPQHLVLHKRSESMMRDLYAGNLCTFEAANELQLKRPAEYFYDWHKTADKCCDNLA